MKDPALLAEMKTYRGRDEVPADFDAFWDARLEEAAELPEYTLEQQDFGIDVIDCYALRFTGVSGNTIYAKVILPHTDSPVPLVFMFHGYRSRVADWSRYFAYTAVGYGVVLFDVPGQAGRSLDGSAAVSGDTTSGHIIRGMLDGPKQLFFTKVYQDVYQLSEIVAQLEQVDETKLYSYGASQGGALALVLAALNPAIKLTVAIYPFLSDFRRVIEHGRPNDAYDELMHYFRHSDPFHVTEDAVIQTLSYIDVKNFAHRIHCPVKMVTGLADVTCYPITQAAIYNRLETEKEQLLLPEYGHEGLNIFVDDTVFNWLTGSHIEIQA